MVNPTWIARSVASTAAVTDAQPLMAQAQGMSRSSLASTLVRRRVRIACVEPASVQVKFKPGYWADLQRPLDYKANEIVSIIEHSLGPVRELSLVSDMLDLTIACASVLVDPSALT